MPGSIVFIAILITAALVAGKYAGKTVINAIRIIAVVLGILTLARNWIETKNVLEFFFNNLLPYLYLKCVAFVNWMIKNAIETADNAVKSFTK